MSRVRVQRGREARRIESPVATNKPNGHVVETKRETKNDIGIMKTYVLTIPGIKIVNTILI